MSWKQLHIAIVSFVVVLTASCGGTPEKQVLKHNLPDLKSYFQKEVAALEKEAPKMHKIVTENDIPLDQNSDSADWRQELSTFQMIDLRAPGMEEKYQTVTDSSGDLKISRYTARDTNMEIQSVAITERKGSIELIEAFLKKRTFVVDRNTRLSYQPGRGYGIVIWEDYIWGKPRTKEVFVQMEAKGHLND